jgi:hypothetical protein
MTTDTLDAKLIDDYRRILRHYAQHFHEWGEEHDWQVAINRAGEPMYRSTVRTAARFLRDEMAATVGQLDRIIEELSQENTNGS